MLLATKTDTANQAKCAHNVDDGFSLATVSRTWILQSEAENCLPETDVAATYISSVIQLFPPSLAEPLFL
jgi:hypothetical protein